MTEIVVDFPYEKEQEYLKKYLDKIRSKNRGI